MIGVNTNSCALLGRIEFFASYTYISTKYCEEVCEPLEKSVDTSPSIIGSLVIIIIVHVVGIPIALLFAFVIAFNADSVLTLLIFIILMPTIFIKLIQFLSDKLLGGYWEYKKLLYIEIILIVISIPFW